MSRSSSLSSKTHKHKKWSESEVPKTRELRKRNEKFGSRRAIQLVKYTITSSNTHLSSSSSSFGSIEAPRFFLSHSSSSSLNRNVPAITTAHFISKISKSAPISRLPHSKPFRFIKENSSSKPISHKLNRIKKSQSSKKPNSETPASLDSNNTAPVNESLSASQDLLQLHKEELQCTPVAVSKIATCSALDCLVAVIGNHKNRRKCRARGVLVALSGPTDNDMSSYNFNSNHVDCDENYTTGLVNRSCVFMLPSPASASLHRLLSPCHVDEKENSAPLNSLLVHKTIPSPSSPLSDDGFSFDLCNLSNNRSDATNSSTGKSQSNTNNMLISTQLPQFQVRMESLRDYALVSSSPNATPYSRAVPLKEEAKHSYNIDGGNASFSADILGSGNVMQTPNSDSSLQRRVGLSLSSAKDHRRHHFHSELHSGWRSLDSKHVPQKPSSNMGYNQS
ncbi:uncharacterized protein LOC111310674 [Durio zibethinus]|uniref:Uncharacterized protein LOC111310674 n=1 Tax=Durio zibethinus TaxID=66656 RepID=A0A6P6ALX2_DURZI|nr:uncharacterized protein LOC111310674 [Durio zibethinus]